MNIYKEIIRQEDLFMNLSPIYRGENSCVRPHPEDTEFKKIQKITFQKLGSQNIEPNPSQRNSVEQIPVDF